MALDDSESASDQAPSLQKESVRRLFRLPFAVARSRGRAGRGRARFDLGRRARARKGAFLTRARSISLSRPVQLAKRLARNSYGSDGAGEGGTPVSLRAVLLIKNRTSKIIGRIRERRAGEAQRLADERAEERRAKRAAFAKPSVPSVPEDALEGSLVGSKGVAPRRLRAEPRPFR